MFLFYFLSPKNSYSGQSTDLIIKNYSLIDWLIYSLIDWLIHSFIHSFIHSLIHSFIHSFIHDFFLSLAMIKFNVKYNYCFRFEIHPFAPISLVLLLKKQKSIKLLNYHSLVVINFNDFTMLIAYLFYYCSL
jgi:hypothetical protein